MGIEGAAWDFVTALSRTTTPQDLADCFRGLLAPFGLQTFGLGELTNPHQPTSPLAPFFINSGPPEWQDRWMAKSYIRSDPNILGALFQQQPFFWRRVRPFQRGLSARIMDEGAEFGLRDGYCIPIHRPRALPGAVSVAGERVDFSPEECRLLECCAAHLYHRAEALMRPHTLERPTRLSVREREILRWIAVGKMVPDIADRLTLSDHTVRSYVKSAMRKLNVTTHAQAVAIGMRTGQLWF